MVNNGQNLVNVVKERPQKVGRYLGTYIVACMETGKKFRMARSKMRNHITMEDFASILFQISLSPNFTDITEPGVSKDFKNCEKFKNTHLVLDHLPKIK